MSVPESMAPASDIMKVCRDIEGLFAALRKNDAEDKERRLKWDKRFLGLARYVAKWSKDPSTKTGGVLVDKRRGVVGVGYNGFACGVDDSPERYADRDTKIAMVVHCEENCLIYGDASRLEGATLYTWPFQSCAKCAGLVIQAGISRCVAPPMPADKVARWGKNMALAADQFREAGVPLEFVEPDIELTEPSPAERAAALLKTYEGQGVPFYGPPTGNNIIASRGVGANRLYALNVPYKRAVDLLRGDPQWVYRIEDGFDLAELL